jgi:hypothetical protein
MSTEIGFMQTLVAHYGKFLLCDNDHCGKYFEVALLTFATIRP